MKRLTSAQKAAIQKRLVQRWSVIIEEDLKTDGFQEDIAEVLGLDLNEISVETHEFSAAVIKAATRWLQKLPEVK